MRTEKNPFRFDYAISFSGAQRQIAQEIAEKLKKANLTVFYDKDYVPELLAEDGKLYLRKLYSTEARFYIVLVSRQYDKSPWTKVELEAIQSRESIEHYGVLIPVITGRYKPKWLPRERIFFDLRESSISALVVDLIKKVSLPEKNNLGILRSNASDCLVLLSSHNPCSYEYAQFKWKIDAKLREFGFQIKRSDGPMSTELHPIIECAPEDRLIGLQVKAVTDTLILRYGPFKGELEGKARIRLDSQGDSIEGQCRVRLFL